MPGRGRVREARARAYHTLPRRLLERYRLLPPIDPEAGPFRYADLDRLAGDLMAAEHEIDHDEEMDVPVFEADTAAEVIAWTRALGLTRLLDELPVPALQGWERDCADALEASRGDGPLRFGGVTRIVRAVIRE